MSSRRRMLIGQKSKFDRDAPIPASWKAVETIKDSWAEIIYHCAKGDYKTRYQLGDTKVANFGSEGLCLMHLVGFDCDELANGSGYCHMAWAPEHCLSTLVHWNTTNSNNGYNSSLFKTHMDGLLTKLPQILQDNIVQVKKTCSLYKNAAGQTVNVKLWPPSVREVYGGSDERFERSGPIYTNPPKSVKMTGSTPNGEDAHAWFRTADYNSNRYIVSFRAGGGFWHRDCICENGALPGFCI